MPGGRVASCFKVRCNERHVIAERHAEFAIIGPPEIRDVDPYAAHFNPHTNRAAVGDVGAVIAVARSAVGECRRLVVAGIAV